MSYLDRLPLYVTSEQNYFCGFPIYSHTVPIDNNCQYVEEQNVSVSNSYSCNNDFHKNELKKEEISDNAVLSYEWVDEALEKMYLNENGNLCDDDSVVDDSVIDNCEKGYNKEGESEEELMFQFELDWDIEKGKY